MARIGLIDVDSHNFPNLALMHISAYHKAQGDTVEWWWSDIEHYDIVYKSKVFSDAYTKDIPDPANADKVIKGGTGYAISLVNGREVFDKDKHHDIPPRLRRCFPITAYIRNMIMQSALQAEGVLVAVRSVMCKQRKVVAV